MRWLKAHWVPVALSVAGLGLYVLYRRGSSGAAGPLYFNPFPAPGVSGGGSPAPGALAAAGAAADPATPPQNASAPPDQKKLEALGAEVQGERDHIVYLQNEWAKSHYGGQSAEQFNAILGAAQAKLAALTAKFQDYMNGVPGVA